MKKTIIISLIALAFIRNAAAQNATLRVQTSAICEQCKDRMEHDLSFEKGIHSAKLNLDDKVVTVVYNAAKTDPAKIRMAISKIGYDADTLKADPKSYSRLPDCCKHETQMH